MILCDYCGYGNGRGETEPRYCPMYLDIPGTVNCPEISFHFCPDCKTEVIAKLRRFLDDLMTDNLAKRAILEREEGGAK